MVTGKTIVGLGLIGLLGISAIDELCHYVTTDVKELSVAQVSEVKPVMRLSDMFPPSVEYQLFTTDRFNSITFADCDSTIKKGSYVIMKVKDGYTLLGLLPEHPEGVSVTKADIPGLSD